MPSGAQCQCEDDSVIICSLQDVMQFKIYINIFGIIRTRCLDARRKKRVPVKASHSACRGHVQRLTTHTYARTHMHTHMYNTWDEILLSS